MDTGTDLSPILVKRLCHDPAFWPVVRPSRSDTERTAMEAFASRAGREAFCK